MVGSRATWPPAESVGIQPLPKPSMPPPMGPFSKVSPVQPATFTSWNMMGMPSVGCCVSSAIHFSFGEASDEILGEVITALMAIPFI